MNLQITNGEGYKQPQGDKYQKISINATYGEQKLNKNDGYNAGVVYSTEATDSDPYHVFFIEYEESVTGSSYANGNVLTKISYDANSNSNVEITEDDTRLLNLKSTQSSTARLPHWHSNTCMYFS